VRWLLFGALAAALSWAAGCTFLVQFNDAPPGTDAGGGSPDGYAPCALRLGDFCGNDSLAGYAGLPTDLVTCANGAIESVRACDAGCLTVPGLPDTCDPCGAKPAGAYCGREFAAFPPDDTDVLVTCDDAGLETRLAVCPGVCLPASGDASCQAP
jgi:hypothetical protein